jgi:phosphoribosylanthranilate isomerase
MPAIKTKAKICGITNLEDAVAAADAGADFLGFIFWPRSKRAITTDVAGAITHALRQRPDCPTLVGVFVDEPATVAASVLDSCLLDLAQLSGGEPLAQINDLQSPLYGRCFKVIRPTSHAEAEAEAAYYVPPKWEPDRPSLLLDAYHPQLPGGSGLRADWEVAASIAQKLPGIMLAGGLTPKNVTQAIQRVRPFAVDVASGVEASPGRKDPALVAAFISEVHSA